MPEAKSKVVVGAGLAGMVAAINLAKAGYEVTVLEAEARIGGSPQLHPSLHITPIDKKKVWAYIGIELDFLRHLNECEAEAREKGEDQTACRIQEAEKRFMINHLGRWAWKFCDLAIEEAKTEFYRGFIRLTKGVLNEEIEPSI